MSLSSTPKIAIDLTNFLPDGRTGGIGIFIRELIPRLAQLAPDTHFILLTHSISHTQLAYLERANVSRHLLITEHSAVVAIPGKIQQFVRRLYPFLPASILSTTRRTGNRIQTLLKRRHSKTLFTTLGIDLLYCPQTDGGLYHPSIPMVCTIHDLQFITYPQFFSSETITGLNTTFFGTLKKATQVVTISNFTQQVVAQYGNIPRSKIRMIYQRMSYRIENSALEQADSSSSTSSVAEQYIIYPANFWKHKNHEFLFTAFRLAMLDGLPEGFKLICTGAPDARQRYLKQVVAHMGCSDRILFTGYVSDAELGTLMRHACGLIFPSLYEGFGMPVLEAMAAKVPVACSNTSCLPEIGGSAALYFNPSNLREIRDAILNLSTMSGHHRAQYITTGNARAALFSDTNRTAREYLDVFDLALQDAKFRKESY